MAFVPLVPANMGISMTAGLAQAFVSGVVNDLTGAAVDLSAWFLIEAVAVPNAQAPTNADVIFGTCTGSAGGIINVTTSAADLPAGQGSARLLIKGKKLTGDALQTLATGTLTVNPGS